MLSKSHLFSLFAASLLISSCSVVNKAYMPTSYEPLQLTENKTTKVSLSLSSSFAKIQVAQVIKPSLAVAANASTGFGSSNFELMGVRFANLTECSFEFGGGVGLQENNIRYSGVAENVLQNVLYSAYYKYYNEKINATYQTAFLCGSVLSGGQETKHRIGFTLKTGIAHIYNYNYQFEWRYGDYYETGKPYPQDSEELKFKGGNFWYLESSIMYKRKINRGGFKLQLGYNYCSPAVAHIYYFEQQGQKNVFIEGQKNHPTCNSVMFQLGFDFTLNPNRD